MAFERYSLKKYHEDIREEKIHDLSLCWRKNVNIISHLLLSFETAKKRERERENVSIPGTTQKEKRKRVLLSFRRFRQIRQWTQWTKSTQLKSLEHHMLLITYAKGILTTMMRKTFILCVTWGKTCLTLNRNPYKKRRIKARSLVKGVITRRITLVLLNLYSIKQEGQAWNFALSCLYESNLERELDDFFINQRNTRGRLLLQLSSSFHFLLQNNMLFVPKDVAETGNPWDSVTWATLIYPVLSRKSKYSWLRALSQLNYCCPRRP